MVFFLILTAKSSVYAKVNPLDRPNNKFGIHILFPDEIYEASKLVNSNGGDWGYVTIPIQSADRNLDKWQLFMDNAKKLHIIPILRLATYPVSDYWPKPDLYDSVDFANFLNSLTWPTKNRYVILYNEPNHGQEWGGEVRPDEYAEFSRDTIKIFKERSDEFFLLNAGFDDSVPNSSSSMDWRNYLILMDKSVPGIFSMFDGWSSHAYPNPGYAATPYSTNPVGIRSYQYEIDFIQRNFKVYGLQVFITETGWDKNKLGEEAVANYFAAAYSEIWNDSYLVTVTPFLLSAQAGDFRRFSLINGTSPSSVYNKIKSLNKTAGNPEKDERQFINARNDDDNSNWSAQKTGIWNRTTRDYLKKILNWLNIN